MISTAETASVKRNFSAENNIAENNDSWKIKQRFPK